MSIFERQILTVREKDALGLLLDNLDARCLCVEGTEEGHLLLNNFAAIWGRTQRCREGQAQINPTAWVSESHLGALENK